MHMLFRLFFQSEWFGDPQLALALGGDGEAAAAEVLSTYSFVVTCSSSVSCLIVFQPARKRCGRGSGDAVEVFLLFLFVHL